MAGTSFVPGLELARGFYADLVAPRLAEGFPDLVYTAALIGSGSEVLGFDTPMSADHHWGPRVMLFLRPEDLEARCGDIRTYLGRHLAPAYRGYSTSYTAPDPNDNGTQLMAPATGDVVNHRVETLTIDGFLQSYLGLRISQPMTTADWLSLPSQKLRTTVCGGVFRDDLGLEAIRQRLAWYPADVSLYLLGCAWARIGQEEHLMGRAGFVGDEIGSALIGGRLVRDVMRVAFLLERQYAPYPKWFGTAFAKLACAADLLPHLETAVHARNWQERETGLADAYEALVRLQRSRGLPVPGSGQVSAFWGRPFRVIHADPIAEAVFAQIGDADLRRLGKIRRLGGIDLISDNTDVLEDPAVRPRIGALYAP